MCSRVYLLDGGETVGIYSEVEHEVLKTILKPWPIWKTQLSPSSTPHSRGGFAPAQEGCEKDDFTAHFF